MSLSLEQRPKQLLESPYQSALRLYGDNQEIIVDVNLGGRKLPVPAALVGRGKLAEIFDGEKYAETIGGMFFITKEMPEEYRHFAAFHELAEHAAHRGFDVTGLAAHLQAIIVELGYAKHTLSSEDFERYFQWRKTVERTNFFSLDDNGLIDRCAERMQKIFESIPKYLTYRRKQLTDIVEE